MYLWFIR